MKPERRRSLNIILGLGMLAAFYVLMRYLVKLLIWLDKL